MNPFTTSPREMMSSSSKSSSIIAKTHHFYPLTLTGMEKIYMISRMTMRRTIQIIGTCVHPVGVLLRQGGGLESVILCTASGPHEDD